MNPALTTTVGSTTDSLGPDDKRLPDALAVVQPDTAATLRTKGRLFVLCEVLPSTADVAEMAADIAETVRREYYYDLSAGVEVSLRRAVRQADRRAAQLLREHRGRTTLHLAALVLVNSELYAVRVGAAQVFLVRRARLFLPGDEPGDLADFVHRTTTRRAASLGAEPDLLPSVWRQPAEAGDTVILAAGALVDGLGAEELKSAAVTLHPRAAAEHVRNRMVLEGLPGSHSAIFVELSEAPGAASRVVPIPELTRQRDEVAIAETIRARADRLVRRVPDVGGVAARGAGTLAGASRRAMAVLVELMPRHEPELPRSPDSARARSRRRQRLLTGTAAALMVVSAAIGALAYRDYERDRAIADYSLALGAIEADIAAAERALAAAPRDTDTASERLDRAAARLAASATSPVAVAEGVAALGDRIATLRDKLANVVVDLGASSPRALVTQLAATSNGIYAADPGSGKLWRLFGEPFTDGPRSQGVVLERAAGGVGAPLAVGAQGTVLFSVDDQRRAWRAEGNAVLDITPADAATRWGSLTAVAVYGDNLYVLDAQAGQVWKHEGGATRFAPGIAFLSSALPANAAKSVAVDGSVWVTDQTGAVLRYQRSPVAATAARVDFTVRWQGEPVRASAVQAVESQRAIYVLDAAGRRVVQITRDGRETARANLPATLPEATAFVVVELARGAQVVTAHGGKIAVTDLGR